jgi:hypothetical protein
MSQWLQVLSGLLAVAASGLVAFRVWTRPPEVKAAPAVYAPVAIAEKPAVVKPGDVYETESPANGFILVVESTPDGAEVIVDGESKGETPASLNFDCLPPKTIALTLKKPGFLPIERTVACKKDTMVVLKARPDPVKHR